MTADLLYSETERDLAAALADLLADRAAPADVIARTERQETYDAKLWRTVAAEIGIAGLLIPEALGGAGASYRELATAAEQFGAFVRPDPLPGQRRGRDGGLALRGAQCRARARLPAGAAPGTRTRRPSRLPPGCCASWPTAASRRRSR